MRSVYVFAMTVGLNLVGGIIAGIFVGWGFDWAMENWFKIKTSPWGFIFFFIVGIIAGFKNAYVDLKRIEKILKSSKEQGKKDSK